MLDALHSISSIGFIGGSHLSIVYAMAALEKTASTNTLIWCYSERPVQKPLNGIQEPGLNDCFEKHQSRFQWTNDAQTLVSCDLIYIALDVPTDTQGMSDLSGLQQLCDNVLPVLNDKAIVVNLSQVPPGWTRAVAFPRDRLFYQVETLVFGEALNSALHPNRFIVGAYDPKQALPKQYREFLSNFDCPIGIMAYESAELAKIAINLYLATMVTTTNMLAELCTAVGARWKDIVPSLRLDPRIGPFAYLSPGLGLTSANIKRDLNTTRSLSRSLGVQATAVEAMLADSAYRSGWVVKQLKQLGFFKKKNTPSTIAICGLTYKPNTPIVLGSAAEQLLPLLPTGTIVKAFDSMAVTLPDCPHLTISYYQTAEETSVGADILLILSPNQEMLMLNWSLIAKQMRTAQILDPFGLLESENYPMLSIWQLGERGPEKTCL
ncbi:MAG: hypothetical protein RLZ35_101 [Pseudomonadota bacterium]|jgi:UDPglucose 6-dehydrogenase